jgi:hypothetical protein
MQSTSLPDGCSTTASEFSDVPRESINENAVAAFAAVV